MKNIIEVLKKNRYYILDAVIFIVTLGGFIATNAYLSSKVSTFNQTQNTIASTNLTYQTNDQIIAAFKKLNITINTDSLPTEKTLVNWVAQTETMAGIAGVTQTLNFTSGELTKGHIIVQQQPGSSLPYVTATIALTGHYDQVLSYISLLYNSYFYTRVDSIGYSLNRTSQAATKGSGTVATPSQSQVDPNAPVIASITVDLFISDAENPATTQ